MFPCSERGRRVSPRGEAPCAEPWEARGARSKVPSGRPGPAETPGRSTRGGGRRRIGSGRLRSWGRGAYQETSCRSAKILKRKIASSTRSRAPIPQGAHPRRSACSAPRACGRGKGKELWVVGVGAGSTPLEEIQRAAMLSSSLDSGAWAQAVCGRVFAQFPEHLGAVRCQQ